jgi:hypothetical protein
MALELNEQQLEIMREVRENLKERFEGVPEKGSAYLCCQVLAAVGRRYGCDDPRCLIDLPEEAQPQFVEIYSAISEAIKNQSTMGIFLGGLELNIGIGDILKTVAPLARLAWLDRMIETRVLA